ncbi:hypothetical protein EW026_g7087 [Hermanssonia centrifuga]|uniref:Uncharacterized protein n=1 Tax=Hermanssonia centrifuga TaxID=98765 RepID=A0A4S4K8Y2_9APHY|nr:hypothetical protein EW026_g7087 [Hermanssonia centrifuga]
MLYRRAWDISASTVTNVVINKVNPLGRISLSPDHCYLALVVQSGIEIRHIVDKKRSAIVLRSPAGLGSPARFVHNGASVIGAVQTGQEFTREQDEVFRIVTVSDSKIVLWETEGPSNAAPQISQKWYMLATFLFAFVLALILKDFSGTVLRY